MLRCIQPLDSNCFFLLKTSRLCPASAPEKAENSRRSVSMRLNLGRQEIAVVAYGGTIQKIAMSKRTSPNLENRTIGSLGTRLNTRAVMLIVNSQGS